MTELPKRSATFLIVLLVVSFFAAIFMPQASAAVSINQVSPAEGPVGDIISLTGQIITVNGSYKIFFDDKEVENGTASQTSVSDTFTVPNSTFGEHLVKLHDVATSENGTAQFTVQTKYLIKALTPPSPKQFQEGANVTISTVITGGNSTALANVTAAVKDPANVTHSSNVTVSIDANGFGETSNIYPTDFDANPHTFYIGTYSISLKKLNDTLSTGSFVVGLTNATEYHRFQTVDVKALNYTATDVLKITIKHGDETVFETPARNATDPGGLITANWTVPANASVGVYRVAVVNVTVPLSSVKLVPDNQTFSIVTKSFACEVKTFNLDSEPVNGIVVEANDTDTTVVTRRTTDEDGLASFTLEASIYDFTAFLNNSQVGSALSVSLAGNLTGTFAVRISCSLSNIMIATRDEKGMALPFVDVTANFTYTTRTNTTVTKIASAQTDLKGIGALRNLFIDINYTISASRYGQIFATKTLNLTSTSWFNTTCPIVGLVVRTLDRSGSPLQNVQVKIYDWGIGLSGLVGEENTGTSGEVTFSLTFGRYFVNVYKDGSLLNGTSTLVANLTHATSFTVYCRLDLTLHIHVVDYFGLGIASADVTLERDGTIVGTLITDGNGVAQFTGLLSDDYRILIHIGEKQYASRKLDNLREPEDVTLKIDKLVSIGGFLTETIVFVTIIFIVLLLVAFLLILILRRRQLKQKEE